MNKEEKHISPYLLMMSCFLPLVQVGKTYPARVKETPDLLETFL